MAATAATISRHTSGISPLLTTHISQSHRDVLLSRLRLGFSTTLLEKSDSAASRGADTRATGAEVHKLYTHPISIMIISLSYINTHQQLQPNRHRQQGHQQQHEQGAGARRLTPTQSAFIPTPLHTRTYQAHDATTPHSYSPRAATPGTKTSTSDHATARTDP